MFHTHLKNTPHLSVQKLIRDNQGLFSAQIITAEAESGIVFSNLAMLRGYLQFSVINGTLLATCYDRNLFETSVFLEPNARETFHISALGVAPRTPFHLASKRYFISLFNDRIAWPHEITGVNPMETRGKQIVI